MTLPATTVELLAVDTVPSTRPAPVMPVVAAACVSPTTFGTATCETGVGGESPPPPQAARISGVITDNRSQDRVGQLPPRVRSILSNCWIIFPTVIGGYVTVRKRSEE